MPSSRKVKHCAYCGRKFESSSSPNGTKEDTVDSTKYHSQEQYEKYKKGMGGLHGGEHYEPDTRLGISPADGRVSGYLQSGGGSPYYYSRPPYACKDCAVFVNAFPSQERLEKNGYRDKYQ